MALRDEGQRAAVCWSLAGRLPAVARVWGVVGPSEEAGELLAADGGPLSTGERALLLLCWALWNGNDRLRVSELAGLAPGELAAVGTLWAAMAEGPPAVDRWVAEHLPATVA